ncbi:MAG TPA: sigma-70 family RNA polymerase sigma factor [Blastocatellia bacterium]|nr:sigma-70 family RNA polymerase sigma factor [Blastocatellia bacterium]
MTASSSKDVTQLLLAWNSGDPSALDQIIPIVYEELRRVARRYLRRERQAPTLQSSALVHEVYLRLIDVKSVEWQDRAHFFAISARLMRQILVDFARRRRQLKRGGGAGSLLSLDEALMVPQEPAADLVALDEALATLASLNPRQGRVVELRYFGGLTEEEIAEVLKISARTVRHDWSLARAWLYRELSKGNQHDS